MGSWVWEDPLNKEMATHSSTLAWEILWTEEPGGLEVGFSLVVASEGSSLVAVRSWLLSLPSTHSRHPGVSSCSPWTLVHRLNRCDAWA